MSTNSRASVPLPRKFETLTQKYRLRHPQPSCTPKQVRLGRNCDLRGGAGVSTARCLNEHQFANTDRPHQALENRTPEEFAEGYQSCYLSSYPRHNSGLHVT